MEDREMINEVSYNSKVREFDRAAGETAINVDRVPSLQKYGIGGALMGATWFGAVFPLAINALSSTVSAADAAVYVACGAIFGMVTGGTLGAVMGGRGR
jgi:hypothetical protein